MPDRSTSLFDILLRQARGDANLESRLSVPVIRLGGHDVGIHASFES